MNCPNCQTPITCGCQKRVAKDGAQVCSKCLPAYDFKSYNLTAPSEPIKIITAETTLPKS